MVIDVLTSQLYLAADLASDVQNSDLFVTLIQIAAYVTPYFLIPATFKFGLGVFGNLAGMVNDRSRGIFDRQKKYRQAKQAQNWSDFKSGTGKGFGNWRQSAPVRRIGTSIGSGWEGRYGFGERGAQARSQIAGLAAQEGVMKNPRWSQINENDDALHALTYGSRSAAISGLMADRGWDRQKAESAAAAAGASVGFGRSQAIAAAQQLATTGTGYATHEDINGNKVSAMEDQIRTIARASGNDKNSAAAIAGYNNFINKQKGRHDLAPGAGTLIGAVHDNIDGRSTTDRAPQLHEAAWNSGSLHSLAQGKGEATKNLTGHWVSEYKEGLRTGDLSRVEKASTAMQEMKSMLSYASGDNQVIINDALAQAEAVKMDFVSAGQGGVRNIANSKELEQIERIARGKARVYQPPDANTLQQP